MAAIKRGGRRAGRRRPSRAKAAKRKAARRRQARAAARRRPAKKAARKKAAPKRQSRVAARRTRTRRPARATTKPSARTAPRRDVPPSVLGRSRRQLSEEERQAGPASGLTPDRMMQAARAGHDELRNRIRKHTETSPELTAGDTDANWEDAYSVGDEAPGGDNPTPDQDRVDDIGKALGIRYRDDEELQGGNEVKERDRHRWELDPASSEDWPHDPKKR